MITRIILITLFMCGCSSTGIVEDEVGTFTITGKVIDLKTKSPVSSALIILTIPEGDSWSLPTRFLLGYTFSDIDGKFEIPANPKTIKHIRHAKASIEIDAYHPEHKQSVEFISRKNRGKPVTVKMEWEWRKSVDSNSNACSYNNKEICKIVSDYLGL